MDDTSNLSKLRKYAEIRNIFGQFTEIEAQRRDKQTMNS